MELSSYRYGSRVQYRQPRKKGFKRLLIFLFCSLFVYSLFIYLAPLPEPKLDLQIPVSVADTPTLAWPGPGNAAVGTLEDGLLLNETDASPQPIASVTKVITALVVLQAKPMTKGQAGPSIVITQTDIDSYQSYISQFGSVANVKLNESLSQYQAMQAMLIPSANNVADTLARWAYGSVDAYVLKANEYLKANGITQTTVADASGFNPGSKSTPADLIKIGQLVLKNEALKEIVVQKEATIPEAGLIKNTNDLLSDNTVIGIKTGNTTEAGGCLLFASVLKNENGQTKTIIGAVLGEDTKASSMSTSRILLASAKSAFKTRSVLNKGQEVGTLTTAWGSKVKVVNSEDLSAFAWSGLSITPKTEEQKLEPAMEEGSEVGSASVDSSQTKLILTDTIPAPSIWWRFTHPLRN